MDYKKQKQQWNLEFWTYIQVQCMTTIAQRIRRGNRRMLLEGSYIIGSIILFENEMW